MAVDTDLSIKLATLNVLHNVRKCSCMYREIKTLAGYVHIHEVGDSVIPHRIVGSVIVEAPVVKNDVLPTGTRITLGRTAINTYYLDSIVLVEVAPSLVSPAIFKTKPAPSAVLFDYVIRANNGV